MILHDFSFLFQMESCAFWKRCWTYLRQRLLMFDHLFMHIGLLFSNRLFVFHLKCLFLMSIRAHAASLGKESRRVWLRWLNRWLRLERGWNAYVRRWSSSGPLDLFISFRVYSTFKCWYVIYDLIYVIYTIYHLISALRGRVLAFKSS